MTILQAFPPPRRPLASIEYAPRHAAAGRRDPARWHVTAPGPYPSHRMAPHRTPAAWIVTALNNSRILAAARRNEERLRASLLRGHARPAESH